MICPNCGSGEISPLTNRCELCGFAPEGLVAVEAPRAEALDDLARQELADRFRLDAFLGRGPESAVFLAREHGSDRQIVVKVLPRATDGREATDERFRGAVQAVAELEHPHIVPVFDFGWTEHLYWYSMQHVRGHSLRTLLISRGPLDLKACLRLVAQVASALDYAHRRGMVHGSLKPENILIDAEGWVHVCDLLVTRALEQPLPPKPPGRPASEEPRPERSPYAAPELLRTPAFDQYALAVLVHESLAGSPPPDPESADVAPASFLAGTRPDVPPHVTHAVRRALSPKPIDRFAGVLDFVAALETATLSGPEGRPSGRPSASVLRMTDWQPAARPVRRRLLVGGSAVLLVVAAIVLRPVVGQLFRPAHFQGPMPVVLPPADTGPVVDTTPPPSLPPGRVARREPPSPAPAPAPVSRRTPTAAPSRPAASPRREAAAPRAEAAAPAPAPAAQGADSGRLFVNASPWGQLYVDGRLVGNTPKANLAIPLGSHTIRVVREGFEPFERVVQVGAGQVVRLTDIVLAERRP